MLIIFATCVTWYFLYSFKPDNVTRNLLSFLHASTAIIFYLLNYNVRDLYHISMGYFILDLVHEARLCKKDGLTLLHFGLIVHHFVMIFTLGTLFNPVIGPYYYRSFFLAEFSNYPMYAYFHTRINYENRTVELVLLFLQAVLYFVLRIIELGLILYETYTNGILYGWLLFAALIIYTISTVWCYKVAKKFVIKWKG